MVAWLLRLGMLSGIYLVNFSQVQAAGAPRSSAAEVKSGEEWPRITEVSADRLADS